MPQFAYAVTLSASKQEAIMVYMLQGEDDDWEGAQWHTLSGFGRDLLEQVPHSESTSDKENLGLIICTPDTPDVRIGGDGKLLISMMLVLRRVNKKPVPSEVIARYVSLLEAKSFIHQPELLGL